MNNQLSSDHSITIVGAGLVGSLLGIHLARRGYEIDLYERRPDMRQEEIGAGRSINLAMSARGIHALAEVGLDAQAMREAIPMRGRMIHAFSGELSFQPYGKSDADCIHSISRGALNQLLLTEAEKTGKCRLHFNHRATGGDPREGRVEFHDERSGKTVEVRSTRLIGTDGSASAIRTEMIRLPYQNYSQEYLSYGYKELTIPAGPDGNFQLERNVLHIWPRRNFMLIALPNPGGSFTCTLFLRLKGLPGFDCLVTPEQVRGFFKEEFPDAERLMPALIEDFFAHPTGHMSTVRCEPWNSGGRTLLIGDAAHAIVPFFGQGMNCGFEDCSVLGAMLPPASEAARADWAAVFSAFSEARKPDTDAIAEMALENFTEMRDKVGNVRFLLEKQVEMRLQKEFPGDYLSRYAMVTFTRLPYRLALKVGKIQDEILGELCRELGSADQLDLERARWLITAKLVPVFRVS